MVRIHLMVSSFIGEVPLNVGKQVSICILDITSWHCFVKSMSTNSGFKNILQGSISNLKFLNHLSSPLGIFVTKEINSGEIGKFKHPTFVFEPMKLMANSFVT